MITEPNRTQSTQSVRLCSVEKQNGIQKLVVIHSQQNWKDYVRLSNCSMTVRSFAFDWQFFFVSSIKFDYRTQSNLIERLGYLIERLGSITERSIDYAGTMPVKPLYRLFNSVLKAAKLRGLQA